MALLTHLTKLQQATVVSCSNNFMSGVVETNYSRKMPANGQPVVLSNFRFEGVLSGRERTYNAYDIDAIPSLSSGIIKDYAMNDYNPHLVGGIMQQLKQMIFNRLT
jgi:hypothetical protein